MNGCNNINCKSKNENKACTFLPLGFMRLAYDKNKVITKKKSKYVMLCDTCSKNNIELLKDVFS